MSVRVREATAADCARLPAFRRQMEGGAFLAELRTEAFYLHKFLRAGRAFVAEEGDSIVGVTGATTRTVRMRGEDLPAADLGDLFVHPDHRGRGLFRELHDALLHTLAEDGVRLVTVRAGRDAAPLLLGAFGYRRLHRIAECVAALSPAGMGRLPLGRIPLLRGLLPRCRRRPPSEGRGLRVVAVEPGEIEVRGAFDGTWPSAGVVRDADRVRMRYAADPTPYESVALTNGEVQVGAAVLLRYEGRGFLVDFWLAPGAETGATYLARGAVEHLRHRGADLVHFWRAREAGPRQDAGAAAVAGLGLRALRRRKVVLYRALSDEIPEPPPPGEWIFRMGDTDGI